MIYYLSQILIIFGIILLVYSFYKGVKFVKFVKVKSAKVYWEQLLWLVGFFIISYIVYFFLFDFRLRTGLLDFLVSDIFFFGSMFIFYATKTGVIFAKEIDQYVVEIEEERTGLALKVKERTKELVEKTKELEVMNRRLKMEDEMRKDFINYTAHELRAPLNAFRWSIEILRNEDLGKINLKQREILDQFYLSNERLLTLVNELLDIARIDEARLAIKKEPCRPEEIIDEAAGNLAVKIREKKINFIWRKPARPLPKVEADRDRILQVLINILGNAVKFTPAKGRIKIGVLLTDEIAPKEILKKYSFVGKNKKYVQISVSDSGLGVPMLEQEKMFGRFFRGSNVKKARIEGTGLGMHIVFEIIKLHQGAIWFESEEGKGTTFYFTLPTF